MDIDQIMTSIKIYSNKTIVSKEKKKSFGHLDKKIINSICKGKKREQIVIRLVHNSLHQKHMEWDNKGAQGKKIVSP